jgi:hypothetical protein
MSKTHKPEGLYYGKLETWDEVKELRESVIRRYKYSTKKNIGSIHRDLLKEGYDIPYDTVRTWVKRSGVKILRPPQYDTDTPEKTMEFFQVTTELSAVLDSFKGLFKKTNLMEYAIRMFVGMKVSGIVVLFFDKGNVVITNNNDNIIAVTTQNLSPGDLKLLNGMVNLAKEHEDWEAFVKQYAKVSGIPYYPMY